MKVKMRGKKSDKIHVTVTELLKNSLLVMKSSGVLVPTDAVGSDSFWQLTWLHVKNIAPNMQTEVFPENELAPVPDANSLVPSVGS